MAAAGAPNLTDRIVLCAGGQHPAGEFGGAIGPGLGRHVHAGTATVDAGEAAGPDFTNDFNGAAHYEPSVSNDLPYYAVCYIYEVSGLSIQGVDHGRLGLQTIPITFAPGVVRSSTPAGVGQIVA